MGINWFPGHMVTARKDAVVALRQTHVVIEVLDARVPHSSLNPMFEQLRRENQRPALKVLNKADLADRARTRKWLDHYNARPGVRAIAVSAKARGEVPAIVEECLALAPGRGTRVSPLNMLILGVPNVGKSTIMNALLGRRLAKVGDEPAITKTQMRHELGPGRWLVDTPGMTWPGVAEEAALKLAITHSIGRNAYDDETAALALASYLLSDYRDRLSAWLGAPDDDVDDVDAPALLAAIARKRNFVIRGGGPDLQKAATSLLNEFRSGALGPITLETVEQVTA